MLLLCLLEWWGIQKLYYSCVYWSGVYTESILLLCIPEWYVYRSCITPLSSEVVCIQKLSQRREEPVRRLLCLTEATLVERDPATYNLITLRPLSMVAALVRPKERETKTINFHSVPLPFYASVD